MKKSIKIIYEVIFIILAIIAVTLALLDITETINLSKNIFLYYVDMSILIIFTIDYFIRLFISKNKLLFIKLNILDLIAIIPFSALFKVFRLCKLFKIVKLAKLTKITRLTKVIVLCNKISKKLSTFVNTNGFIYVLIFTIVIILIGSIGIYVCEKGQTINTFSDAIWWSFVTATTVGYGDISPVTTIGRIIAALLMLIGIGTIGMLTGTIATYFINKKQPSIKNNSQILDLSELSEDDYNKIISYVEFVKSFNNNSC